MKLILIYNTASKFLKLLQKKLEGHNCWHVPITKTNTRSTYDIWNEINKKIENDNFLIFLQVKINYLPQHDFYYGIELLKELRARYHFDTPNLLQKCQVVLCSAVFSQQRLLSMDPSNFIIASPGTTFLDLLEVRKLDLEALKTRKLRNIDELKPFYKVADKTLEERHSYANWWAANRLSEHLNQLSEENKFHFNSTLSVPILRDAAFIYSDTNEEASQSTLNPLRKKIINLQTIFHQKNLNILLIDDQADQIEFEKKIGWKQLYEAFIFKQKRNISTLAIADLTNEEVLQQIDDIYHCILLDLMLTKTDQDLAIEQTRGAKLLVKIKNEYPMLPVIVTTASNKAEKRKTLRQLGCDAYWIKEGVDEQLGTKESLERYVQLLDLLRKLTNTNYTFLRDCMVVIKKIEQRENWWEQKINPTDSAKTINKSKIINVLKQSLYLLRTYLHNQVMGEGYRTKLEETFWLAGVIIKLSAIVETVNKSQHQNLATSDNFYGNNVLEEQLHAVKQKVGQYTDQSVVDFGFLKEFFVGILCYLFTIPAQRSNLPIEDTTIYDFILADKNYHKVYSAYFLSSNANH